jgi:hypothetical protein
VLLAGVTVLPVNRLEDSLIAAAPGFPGTTAIGSLQLLLGDDAVVEF